MTDQFSAADMATASADGFRAGNHSEDKLEMVALKGQRMVLCSLLGECRGHLQEAADAMYTVEEEAPLWDLVERIESALNVIAEERAQEGKA